VGAPLLGTTITLGLLVTFMPTCSASPAIQQIARPVDQYPERHRRCRAHFRPAGPGPRRPGSSGALDLPRITGKLEFDASRTTMKTASRCCATFRLRPSRVRPSPSSAPRSRQDHHHQSAARFYDVLEGAIRIDGVDVRDVKLESIRRQVASAPGYVPVQRQRHGQRPFGRRMPPMMRSSRRPARLCRIVHRAPAAKVRDRPR